MSAFTFDVGDDGLGVLTFDLPGEKVNKLSREVFAELSEILARMQREPRLRGLLVRSGKPDVFVAGADLKDFTRIGSEDLRPLVERGQAIFEQIAGLPWPTIAAIGGVCLGGGTELALACDYRLMSDAPKARIGLPEVRLGIYPAWGGCTRLPKLVGLQAALDLILTGKQLDARRARRIGLVDEAVPAAIFESFARKFAAGKLGGGKPRAVAARSRSPRSRSKAIPLGRRLVFSKARAEGPGGDEGALSRAVRGAFRDRGGLWKARGGRPRGGSAPSSVTSSAARYSGTFSGSSSRPRRCEKETGVPGDARPRPVSRVGVLGAGVMGGGIAPARGGQGHSRHA